MEFPNIYAGDYKKQVFIPIALVIIALFFIPQIPYGVELKGGILITLQTEEYSIDSSALTNSLSELGVHDITLKTYSNPAGAVAELQIGQNEHLANAEEALKEFYPSYEQASQLEPQVQQMERTAAGSGEEAEEARQQLPQLKEEFESARQEMEFRAEKVLVECDAITGKTQRDYSSVQGLEELVRNAFSKAKEGYKQKVLEAVSVVPYTSYSYNDVTPSLSKSFMQKALTVVIVSAALSMLVVFIVFRDFIPSIAVLTGATCDIIIALGAMGLFGIPLTLASFAALLMLVGLSLDTDILLTIRVLKRTEGNPRERAYETMKTGLTMSTTALVAFSMLFILSLITHIPTYYQISSVAIAGLLGDLVATWNLNAVMILWHVERKKR